MIQFDGHSATVCSLAYSPDSLLLASGAKDGGVRLWHAGGVMVKEVAWQRDLSRNALAWSPSGECLATALGPKLTLLQEGRAERFESEFKLFMGEITSLAFLADGLLTFGTGARTGGVNGTLHLWDAISHAARPMPGPVRGVYGVRALAAHAASKHLHWIAGLANTTSCVWRSWCITSPNATDTKLNKPAADIAVTPDGATVAIASDWLVRVFAVDGKPKTDLSGHKGQVSAVGFVNGGRTVVSASWDATVRFWDVATGKETARFPLSIGKLTALAVSPDGTRVAVGGTDGPIVVIDTE
jgi:WD40 repeat protein